jgi:hypothetical protein
MTKLKTLDELEENSSLNIASNTTGHANQIEEVFNIKIHSDESNRKGKGHLDPNLISLSPRSTYSNSSQLVGSKSTRSKQSSPHKSSTKKSKDHGKHWSERSVSSMSNRSLLDEVTIVNANDELNADAQSVISLLQQKNAANKGSETSAAGGKSPKIFEPVDYDKIAPLQSADLTKISYVNSTERYLITRLACILSIRKIPFFLFGRSTSTSIYIW